MSNEPPQPQPTPVRASPKLIAGGALVVILGFGLPALFGGADAAPAIPAKQAKLAPEPIAPPSAGSIGLSLLKLVGGLAVMCGVCVLVAKYATPKPTATPQAMTVAAALRVGACTVHLVVAGDRRLLVGTDGSGVKAVLELPPVPEAPPADAPPAAAPAAQEGAPVQTEIIQLLLKLRDRTSAPG
jgi:flagellar biogenesis protein FliO